MFSRKIFLCIIFVMLGLGACNSSFEMERRSLQLKGKQFVGVVDYPHASGRFSEEFNELIDTKTQDKIAKFKTDMADYHIYDDRTLIGTYEVWEWSDTIVYIRQHFQGTIPKSYDKQMNYFEETKFDLHTGQEIRRQKGVDGVGRNIVK